MSAVKVVVVGAGATGALISSLLQRSLGKNLSVEVWDKSRGVGGRMTTSRVNQSSSLSVDMGAQYISVAEEYMKEHKNIYDELQEHEILAPLKCNVEGLVKKEGTQDFVMSHGSNSLPKYFLTQAGCSVTTSTTLETVDINQSKIQLVSDNVQAEADIVVLTMPVPQILKLKGNISSYVRPYQKNLKAVEYSSRYSLGLFYPVASDHADVDWCFKYVNDNPCLRYVAIDTVKRQTDPAEGLSVVAHTSVPFGVKHLEESFEDVQPIIFENLKTILPNLPEAKHSKIVRWRYSQVTTPYDGEPGCLVLNRNPLLVCAGDGFKHSNLDGCIQSAISVVDAIKRHLSR